MVSSLVFLAALFGVSEGRLRYGRRDLESSDKLHVLISLNNDPSTFTSSLAHSISYGAGLTRVNAVSAVVSKEDYNSLMDHPDVKSVELDEMLYPDSFGETFPYGIAMTQGVDPSMGTKAASTSDDSACSSPSSFKVAIIDSGLEVAHPDVTCRSIDDEDTNCVGMSFVEGGNEKWYAPQSTHGTHVYGTIGASRSNNQGVSGMLTDDNVCFLIGQVFGKDGGARTSTIMNAVEWAVNQGAKVINMSLGKCCWRLWCGKLSIF